MSYMYFISLTPHTLRVFSTSISKFAFSPTALFVMSGLDMATEEVWVQDQLSLYQWWNAVIKVKTLNFPSSP